MLQCASVGAKTRSAKEALKFGGNMFKNCIISKKLLVTVFAAVVAISLCVAFCGCAPGSYNPQKKDPQLKTPDILENGKLKVGVDFGNPPFAGETSKAAGIDIDVASAIADDLGLEVEFVDVGTSPDLAIENKKVDIVMGISKATNSDEI